MISACDSLEKEKKLLEARSLDKKSQLSEHKKVEARVKALDIGFSLVSAFLGKKIGKKVDDFIKLDPIIKSEGFKQGLKLFGLKNKLLIDWTINHKMEELRDELDKINADIHKIKDNLIDCIKVEKSSERGNNFNLLDKSGNDKVNDIDCSNCSFKFDKPFSP